MDIFLKAFISVLSMCIHHRYRHGKGNLIFSFGRWEHAAKLPAAFGWHSRDIEE
jgi:hypothetical protein